MESIQRHIEVLESKIDLYRFRAKKLRKWGRIAKWPIPGSVLVIGAFAAFAVILHGATTDPLIGGPRISHFEKSLYEAHPLIWSLLYLIGPPQIVNDPHQAHIGYAVWLAGWGLLIGGLKWLGERALKKSVQLEARAEKYDDILIANKPTWLSLDTLIQMQGLKGGDNNVIHIVKQINKMINQPEENKNWYVLPAGIVLLGVISTTLAAAITKLLGLT